MAVAFETERLIIRTYKLSDLDDFYEYASVPGVGEQAGWLHHESIEETKAILLSFMKQPYKLAIELKDSHKMIGSISFQEKQIDPKFKGLYQIELGYLIGNSYWGKGLMTEACKGALEYGFEELKADVIMSATFAFNVRSRNVIRKLGMKFLKEGYFFSVRQNTLFKDRQYIITKEKYLANRNHKI